MRENEMLPSGDLQNEMLSLDELEAKLYGELEGQLSGLEFLEKEREKISDPEGLEEMIGNAVWEQFILQIGPLAGRDFIESNKKMKLDLRDKAHIQTTENFKNGIIATHNYHSKEQLEQNYDRYKDTSHKEFRKEYVDPKMNGVLKRSGVLYNQGIETS